MSIKTKRFVLPAYVWPVLICLMLPKAFYHSRTIGKTSIYSALYINGFRFYICTFAVSVANITALLYPLPTALHPTDLMELDRILHAIFAERLLFAIRGAFDEGKQVPTTLLSLEFRSRRPHTEEEESIQDDETDSERSVFGASHLV